MTTRRKRVVVPAAVKEMETRVVHNPLSLMHSVVEAMYRMNPDLRRQRRIVFVEAEIQILRKELKKLKATRYTVASEAKRKAAIEREEEKDYEHDLL